MTEWLWAPTPEQIKSTHMHAFQKKVEQHVGRAFTNFPAFYQWSIDHLEDFWQLWLKESGMIYAGTSTPVIDWHDTMYESRFFPNLQLNYAENLLAHHKNEDTALVFWAEDKVKETWTFQQLKQAIYQAQQKLKEANLKPGDRVAAYIPNTPESLIWMLATTALGGVWCSCSQDFGIQGALDRFSQIKPKVFLAADGSVYKGKTLSATEKVTDIVKNLPTVTTHIWLSYLASRDMHETEPPSIIWQSWNALKAREEHMSADIEFHRLPFDHPLFIMFSSGTTGLPKCIVHGAGGTLLQHLKEHKLHCDIHPGDRLFYYTTTGWMMWNWQVSALASGAALLLFDGAPFSPSQDILMHYANQEHCTHFGTAAKYVDTLRSNAFDIKASYPLKNLRMITSTGSPLVTESFHYLYSHLKKDMCVASISGGTDIISCFALGNPTTPVYAGELQTRGLGLAVEIYDTDGNPIRCEKGELVCTKPFPCMPVRFWDDTNNKKYKETYFSTFNNIWCHGDFAEITMHDGLIIYGRSDATLNPGGVRIGTAEIYRQVEQLPEIDESLVVGKQVADDVQVWLFVKMKEGEHLNEELIQTIKSLLKTNASPRHVPAKIIAVPDIPKTKNGKLVELAVYAILHGKQVKNKESLANPETLDFFKKFV